ncbi:MAG: tetratricopeptide repeat protein [Terracidiphilus sp.]
MIPSLLRPWLLLTSIFLAQAFVPSICSTQELPAGSATEDEARSAMLHGDYAGAEKLYRGAIEKNPASATLLTDLGVALQMQGRASEAIQVFERALKEKYLPQTYALLAEQRCISRDLDGARPMLSKIIRDYAGEAKLIAIVAPCYLDLDEPVESVSAYTVLLRDAAYPHDLALIRLAKSYLAAAQYFVRKLEERSDSNAYVTALSQAGASGDPRSAFPIAQRMSPNFHADLGFDEVLAIWHRHPDDPALLYQLAVISGEQSMRQIGLCSQMYPDSPYLAQLQFEMLADRGKEEDAAGGFEGLLHSHPELPDLRYDLGMLYRKQRQWDKALAVFRDELSANPNDERAAARVSEALVQLMRWTELRDFLSPRLQEAKAPLWATLDLAEALEQLGEPRKAIALLSNAESEYPSSRAVHFRLLHLYRSTGDMPKAVAEAKWLKSQPG